MTLIERVWQELAAGGVAAQTLIDANHPHDIYGDFEPPDRVGLALICSSKPPDIQTMRALEFDDGLRGDGRWTLRISLVEPTLRPVFAALAEDILEHTRLEASEQRLASAVVQRLTHWRTLLDRDGGGLGATVLRGLIGELLFLRDVLLPSLGPSEAVRCWKGPFGAPQDFILSDGRRFEVKATRAHADKVRINGLEQLDARGDPLVLAIVRTEDASPNGPRSITATSLIDQLRRLLSLAPATAKTFDAALREAHWHEHASHAELAVRLIAIEQHHVGPAFPKLTRADVPIGIIDLDYTIALPPSETSP